MKKELRDKLESPEIDRNFAWFWKNHIKPNVTYDYFMAMLNDNRPQKLTPEIEEIITNFIKG